MPSWKDLIDRKLEKQFSASGDSGAKQAEKRRNGVLQNIDAAIAALKKGDEKGPRGWYQSKGGVTRATLRSGSKRVLIEGEDTVYVPTERAVEFYTGIRKDVAGGAFDAGIAQAWSGEAGAPAKQQRRKRGPMDPAKLEERNRKRAATLAAKKAAQGK